MNGRKAKQIRKAVYGENSIRAPREYIVTKSQDKPVPGSIPLVPGRGPTMGLARVIENKPGSLRSQYQKAKRAIARA